MIESRKCSDVVPVLDKDGIVGKKMYVKENAEAVHISFEPGAVLKKHKTPVDVFFYVLEGTAKIEIGDEEIYADKDSVVESPKNIPHGIANTGEIPLKILVVKAPKP